MANLLATGWDAMNRYRKIEEATAPKDDPAPVYLLDEIADMARQSPEAATAIAEAAQKKLGSRHPITKFKALRIIKHLSTKGCSHFQRCMQRHSGCVRELIHWRGEPDPFKGDVPNARVREFAKEVVEVMFNSTPVQSNTNTLAAQGKIQGFGSGGPEQASSSSSGHYGGFSSSSNGQYGGFSSSGSASRGSGISGSIPTSFADAQRAASQLTQAAQQALGEGPLAQGITNVLGGFLGPAGYSGRLNEGDYRDMSPEPSYGSATAYAAPTVTQVSANQVLGSEAALVDDITTPGGVRALPDPADLRRFVDTAGSMDGLRLAELLREKLESPRWQVVLRALAALEAILQRGSTQACGEVAVMFQSDPSPVRNTLSSPQAQVQRLAATTLKLLTGEDVQVTAAPAADKKGSITAAAAAAAAAKAPIVDLLGDESPEPSANSHAAAPASAIDLLADLAEPAPPPAAPAAAPPAAAAPAAAGGVDSLFDGLGVHAPAAAATGGASASAAAAAAGASSNGDMFGGLTVEPAAAPAAPSDAAAAAAPAAVAAAPAANKQTAPLDELFAGLTTSPTPAAGGSLASGLTQPQHLQQQQQQQDWLGGDLGVPAPKLQQPAHGMGLMQPNGLQQQQQQMGFAGNSMQMGQQWQPLGQIPAHSHGPGSFSTSMGPQGLPGTGQPAAAAAAAAAAAGFSGSAAGGFGSLHSGMQHAPHVTRSGSASASSNSGSGALKGGALLQGGAGVPGSSGGSGAWSGHDDVSNLMRQVAHGGKYDPAFDFVADEFKSNSKR